LVEFPATGGAIPSYTFRTVKLIRYVTVTDYFILACEFIFVLFIVYYMIEEGIEVRTYIISIYRVRVIGYNATFNNISIILWRSVLLVEETGVP
jgi:hypothetical protein